jgi:hypothetical protein
LMVVVRTVSPVDVDADADALVRGWVGRLHGSVY